MSIFRKKSELFRITEGDTAFCLTNANRFQTYNDEVYEPTPIQRSSIQLKSDMEKNNVTLTLPIINDLAKRYVSNFIEQSVGLTIYETYNGETLVIWKGRLKSVGTDGAKVELRFENGTTKRLKNGAYRRYQRLCPHALYGDACKLNKTNFEVDGEVKSLSKATVVIYTKSSNAASYFVGGILSNANEIMRYVTKSDVSVASSNTITQTTTVKKTLDTTAQTLTTRTIIAQQWPSARIVTISDTSQTESYETEPTNLDDVVTTQQITLYETTLTLFNQFSSSDLSIGSVVLAYAGCDKSNSTCATKFNNIVNFGGFPYIPNTNPFVGTII